MQVNFDASKFKGKTSKCSFMLSGIWNKDQGYKYQFYEWPISLVLPRTRNAPTDSPVCQKYKCENKCMKCRSLTNVK